ncbi:c2h2 type zinc finger containing protein [Fusarium austroafricanum]|uniref:C2h2 type zinc finger containing protein n=1 Tax=Fusarium austroafricanum TaxID=2364996 RepID=A0A8H4KWL7_9HYPO|nr:c2h2 type zinc finger containing protein [Fusarium austroafricanum]
MASRWFTLLLLVAPSLALDNNFDFYPKGAQPCLQQAASDASCTGSDSKELNYCLCGLGNYNNDFILGSARCIGEKSPKDIDSTYDTMNKACSTSNTPMKVTKKQFEDAAHEGPTTTASKTATATDSASTTKDTAASSTESNTNTDTGLGTGATAGIAVGAAVGGAAIVGLFVWMFMRRRKKHAEESHPMLPNYENREGSPYQLTEPKSAWSAAGTPQPGWGTPDPNAGYYTPQKPQNGPVELPPDTVAAPTPTPVYEMDGTGTAVEMLGSTPVDGPGSSHGLPGSSHGMPVSPASPNAHVNRT